VAKKANDAITAFADAAKEIDSEDLPKPEADN
jgi:hypothetical protein